MKTKYLTLIALLTLMGCLIGCAETKCTTDPSGRYSCSYNCENFDACDECGN